MSAPEISVVIPTFGRETRLAFALDALARQTVAPERFEVVVVRATGENGPLTTPPPDLEVRFLESEVANASEQRNRAWRSSRAPVIAFTDDDCRPTAEWLERLLEAGTGADVFVQGRTEPDPEESHLLAGPALSQEIVGPSDWYETCNMAYPRALLERLGGFDGAFAFGGEDTDLGLRAIEAGARRVYTPSALVWHAVVPQPLHRALADAKPRPTTPLVFVRHPEHRRALHLRVFWTKRHARLLLALAGLALLRRRPWAAAAGFAPYLVPQLRPARGHGRKPTARGSVRMMLELGERLVLDLAAMITSVRRSLRHGTLVL